MNIIALDMAASTGWATCQNENIRFGTKVFAGERPERLAMFMKWLRIQINGAGYDVVAFERPFTRGMAATRSGWGFAGVCEATAFRCGCAVLDVAVPTIKKSVGITGGQKPIEWAQAQGYDVKNDHEADALALLHYTIANAEIINAN